MLVLACFLIQTHDVTKSPLSCFVSLVLSHWQGSGTLCTAPAKRKGPVAGAFNYLVGAEGLEPSILAARDFKSPAYANSATPPCVS
ncbi:unknown [Collinsella sp. CAG:289]|nr:unknown [Collinsella sp. CAG:289]